MRRVVSVVSALALAAVLAGACSSSGSSGKSSGGATVSMTAKDFAYTPTAVSVKAGKVTFEVKNAGSVEHNLTIAALKVNTDVEDGKTASAPVDDVKPGTYAFHCEYHPTKMKGTITVTG
jgi:plastocyanin